MSSSSEHEFQGDIVNDSDSENDSSEEDNPPDLDEGDMRGGAVRMNRNMVLRDFFRLIAGPRLNVQETAADNTELVNILKELHVVRSQRVERALLMCPRGTFIPTDYADDAYFDAPIRVEDMEFNISAPHMHATCLEALELQPGDRFLDIGSGCGIVAACGAYLVGKNGEVVAAEIKQQILDFSISCVQKLRDENQAYRRDSCEVEFLLRNAFIPTSHKDYFDKIHVGGTCPEDKLPNLIRMLKADGGRMTVPVGQELRLITRKPNGGTHTRVLTQVRFSELTVPSDADIVLSTMNTEREEKMLVNVPPSTLTEDTKLVRSLSEGNHNSSEVMHEGTVPSPNAARKVKRSISKILGFRHGKEEPKQQQASAEDVCLDLVHFAEPDCALVGEEWTLSSHRAVLKVRCEYFRARFDSDMQDAGDEELSVPSQFSQEAMSLFLRYIYKDELQPDLSPQTVIDVLHVACYYGVPRLVVLCESQLAEALKTRHAEDPEAAADFAAVLLTLTDSNGLASLQDAVLQYIVEHFDMVSKSKSYAELSKREVDLIMNESFGRQQRFKKLLADLSGTDKTQ